MFFFPLKIKKKNLKKIKILSTAVVKSLSKIIIFYLLLRYYYFSEKIKLHMVDVLKFRTPKFLTKRHMQTVQTQIGLLLKEQSDQVLHCLPFYYKHFKRQMHKKQN